MSFQNTKINPKRFHPSQIKFYLFLLPLAVVMSIPVLFVLLSAFKPMEELFKFPPTIFPRNWTLENFAPLPLSRMVQGVVGRLRHFRRTPVETPVFSLN